MAYSKVRLNGNTLIDLTQDTVTASDLVKGNTAHNAAGEVVTGTAREAGERTVFFRDYDGTVVESYTPSEFAKLTALPANPTHTGLTAQGWNWTLSDAKTHVAAHGHLDIGQMYVTDDGKTRLYITIDDLIRPDVTIKIKTSVANDVELDWGDGSSVELVGAGGSTLVTVSHSYASSGNYIIILNPLTGRMTLGGSSTSHVLNTESSSYYCNLLKKIEFGLNVAIDQYAFHQCRSLETISIPNTVTSIGSYAFDGCWLLANVNLPSQMTVVSTYLFSECRSLKTVSIPICVEKIYANAFDWCISLLNVSVPNNVDTIGGYAFQHCHKLKTVNIPIGVSKINDYTFAYCYALASLNIPNTVTSIGQYVFRYDYCLSEINIPDNVRSIGLYCFNSCYVIKNITIPDNVTSIPTYLFSGCMSLENVDIPNTVTSIASYAFQNCNSLKNVNIPEGVKSITTYAFSDCHSLKSVIIPSTVTSIAAYAFSSNYSVKEFHLLPTTPPTLSNKNAFNKVPDDCVFYVPYSADHSILDAYKAKTNWSTYKNQMQEEPQS